MAANGPITGIQQHFNLYRIREIKEQRNMSAAIFDNERELRISSEDEDGDGKKWIPPMIQAENHRPRVPLPMNIKTVVYTPHDAGLQHLKINRKGLSGSMKQTDSYSEIYFGNFDADNQKCELIFN